MGTAEIIIYNISGAFTQPLRHPPLMISMEIRGNTKYRLCRNPEFSRIVKHLFRRGQCLSPRTAPSLCDCVVLHSLELSLPGSATAGAEALQPQPPKSVQKNIL